MDKIINLLINNWTKGVDTYTHNGSTWLIFTEQRSWVIELTECKTLWYNYNFFKELFSLTSMDVVDNQHYITKWVEDNIIGGVKYTSVLTNVDFGELEEAIQNGVKRTVPESIDDSFAIEDTIQNGVKETQFNSYENKSWVEGVIKGGVKETEPMDDWVNTNRIVTEVIDNGVKETNHVDVMKFFDNKMEDTLKNGVRHTLNTEYMPTSMVEDIIQSGVKETRLEMNITEGEVDDIIQDGVKLTQFNDNENKSWVEGVIKEGVRKTLWISTEREGLVNTTINKGVKETKTPGKDGDILSTIEWMEENKSTSYTEMINDVIENGIKEVQPLPEQSGELIGYGNYYKLKEDRTKPFIDYLEETIKFGVKESLG